jgi:hypothetical protein
LFLIYFFPGICERTGIASDERNFISESERICVDNSRTQRYQTRTGFVRFIFVFLFLLKKNTNCRYDTTLMYVDAITGKTETSSGEPVPGPSTFSLFFRPSSHVHLHVKRYTMTDLPKQNAELEKWLIDAFVAKQKLISDFRITHKFPDPRPQPLSYPSMNIE